MGLYGFKINMDVCALKAIAAVFPGPLLPSRRMTHCMSDQGASPPTFDLSTNVHCLVCVSVDHMLSTGHRWCSNESCDMLRNSLRVFCSQLNTSSFRFNNYMSL